MDVDGESQIFEWGHALRSLRRPGRTVFPSRITYEEYNNDLALIEHLHLEGYALRASMDAEKLRLNYLREKALPASYASMRDMHTRLPEHVHNAAAQTGAQGEKSLRLLLSKLGMASVKRQSDKIAILKEIQAIEENETTELAQMKEVFERCDRAQIRLSYYQCRVDRSTNISMKDISRQLDCHTQWLHDMRFHDTRDSRGLSLHHHDEDDSDSEFEHSLEATYYKSYEREERRREERRREERIESFERRREERIRKEQIHRTDMEEIYGSEDKDFYDSLCKDRDVDEDMNMSAYENIDRDEIERYFESGESDMCFDPGERDMGFEDHRYL